MEKIQFDSGVKSYKLGSGVLKFNPADPNVYARFLEASEKLRDVEKELVQSAAPADGAAVVELMARADRKIKDTLDWVFGCGNDFDKLLGGINLLAVAGNGERVVTNLFAALEPVLVEGAKACAGTTVQSAVAKAKQRRGDFDTLSVTPDGVTPLPEGEARKC